MAVTPADVQSKIDAGTLALSKANNSWDQMVKKHGSDWRKWPTSSQWYIAMSSFAAARAEVGELPVQTLAAEFHVA